MPELQRVQVLKVLGVTLTNGLSVSLHVQNVITTCAQTLYALRVFRAHGLCDSALQIIFRAVIVAKLMYASSAWWGTSAMDRQNVKAFILYVVFVLAFILQIQIMIFKNYVMKPITGCLT